MLCHDGGVYVGTHNHTIKRIGDLTSVSLTLSRLCEVSLTYEERSTGNFITMNFRNGLSAHLHLALKRQLGCRQGVLGWFCFHCSISSPPSKVSCEYCAIVYSLNSFVPAFN